MKRKMIGFLGGTFDPIHLGHINLALRLQEKCHLDEVILSPAYLSPFKQKSPPQASAEDRKRMVEIAIAGIPHFSIDEGEIIEKKISYTIDALQRLRQQHPQADWRLLLAEDEVARLSEWKEIEELFRIAPPLIGMRTSPFSQSRMHEKIKKNFIPVPVMEISSSEIRERLKKEMYCGHLVHAKVLDYIYQNKLYSSFVCK